MFRTMRRKEEIMSEEETKNILNKAEFGTLACIGENGYPYSVPLNYAYDNGKLYFHSAQSGHKIDNISFNDKVCFSAVGYYKYYQKSLIYNIHEKGDYIDEYRDQKQCHLYWTNCYRTLEHNGWFNS